MVASSSANDGLWLYRTLSRLRFLDYRGKIMVVAFLGIHIPLLVLVGYALRFAASQSLGTWQITLIVLGATLAGTAITLTALYYLLQPIKLTADGLRAYAASRDLPRLPTHYRDEAGTLMAEAARTVTRLELTLEELANYDAITGLANRQYFLALVQQLIAKESHFAFGTIGVINYNRIVAIFGQVAADIVLRETARRLENVLGPTAILGRVDDRVLAVVLPDMIEPVTVSCEFERVSDALTPIVHDETRELLPEIATGVTLYPGDGNNPQRLLDNALTALGTHVEKRGTGIAFYSTAAREAARERFSLEQELRKALADNQFVLHFQCSIDCEARRLIGAEALIRWQHPERGLIPPGKFIPVAEASGLVDEIGLWVLEAACLEVGQWHRMGIDGLRIAINLSARQFRDRHLVDRIHDTITAQGIGPSALELELTETATMEDARHTREVFGQLREMGISVVIDDFGSGYSSMRNLQTLPFDKLKIDRAFVSKVEAKRSSQAICKALIALSQGLGIDVLAEGTETREEVRELYRLGCCKFQGFYFSRPLAAEDFHAQIVNTSWLKDAAAIDVG